MIDTTSLTTEELALYEKLVSKLPSTITETDYAIFIALLASLINDVELRIGRPTPTNWATATSYIIGDKITNNNSVYICLISHTADNFISDLATNKWEQAYNEDGTIATMRVSDLYRQFDVNTADELYLRELAKLVGYDWLEILSVEANRARLAHHGYRRKYRGTLDSIKNLIRASIDEESFYSNAENTKIKLIENGHVITVELPEDFLIFRLDIEEVRPAGTVIQFLYRVVLELALLNIAVLDNMNQYTILIQNASTSKETIDAESNVLQYLPKFCRDSLGQLRALRTVWNRPIVMMSTSPLYVNDLYIEIAINTDPVSGS